MPRLSIVVPVYNEAQTIGQVLERVESIDIGALEREVIVVDEGSTDGRAQMIAERMDRGTRCDWRTSRSSIWGRARQSRSASSTPPATSS
jgi:glycosyltransferase involved in cell wall biosynthesis